MSTEVGTPVVLKIASVAYERNDGKLTLRTESDEGVKAEFLLDTLATAMILLTANPAAKLALADLDRLNPEAAARRNPAFPDSPEGLEG